MEFCKLARGPLNDIQKEDILNKQCNLLHANLGVIFDSTLTMSNHISSVTKSCFLAIRDLRRIRSTLDYTTAQNIATSLIHFKVDYCNSLLTFLALNWIVFNSFLTLSLGAVSKTPKFTHISPVLK